MADWLYVYCDNSDGGSGARLGFLAASFADCSEEDMISGPLSPRLSMSLHPTPVGIALHIDMRDSDILYPLPSHTVTVVIGIIWVLASLVQLFFALKGLKAIPSMTARGPYIILSVITLALALYEILYASLITITYRHGAGVLLPNTVDGSYAVVIPDTPYLPGVDITSLLSAAQFFWIVDTAFRPAVVLYLVHQRGDVLRAVKGNTTFPLSTRIWKHIMDWALVIVALIIYIVSLATWADELPGYSYNPPYYFEIDNNLYGISLILGQTGLALLILLCVDVGVSLTFQVIQGKGTPDPISTRLVTTILPLFGVYVFEVVFFAIFPLVTSGYDYWAFTLSETFIDGAVRIAITMVLILTMTLPGVSWTPQQAVEPDQRPVAPQKMSSSSPTNAGLTPQQQPESYWPQPHVLPHEMPLGMSHEGNPYALPSRTEATRPIIQQPVAEIYSTTLPAPTQAMTYQQPVAETHTTNPRTLAQTMPYQPLYPSSTRALPYQSHLPESTPAPAYRSPWPGSTQPLPYQVPLPVKPAPKQYQSVPIPTGERFTHARLPEEKKEKE